ncbi:hypothetical protein C8J56DRAFT_882175 [Mycena floridula]|nr:hypothetical protein C8J56DRAFT_882175 [Mycena floridula]
MWNRETAKKADNIGGGASGRQEDFDYDTVSYRLKCDNFVRMEFQICRSWWENISKEELDVKVDALTDRTLRSICGHRTGEPKAAVRQGGLSQQNALLRAGIIRAPGNRLREKQKMAAKLKEAAGDIKRHRSAAGRDFYVNSTYSLDGQNKLIQQIAVLPQDNVSTCIGKSAIKGLVDRSGFDRSPNVLLVVQLDDMIRKVVSLNQAVIARHFGD